MTYQPVIVGSGLNAWQFLTSTKDTQQAVFNKDTVLTRDTEYFAQNIGNIETAEQLVDDRRLLRVALGAFGLEDDLNNKFFIKTILEGGVVDPTSLANRLTDERYRSLAKAFEFDGIIGPRTSRSGFADEIVSKFREQSFEIAVGAQDESLRLSLNFGRQIGEMADESISDNAKWFRVMGTTPLRTVLETALNLPSGFGQLDIDKQLDIFREKMDSRYGVSEIDEMAEPDVLNRIVQGYLLQNQISDGAAFTSSSVALTLLQSIN